MDTASDKALQRFAELMIEKIQQVEDNWQQPWFSTKGGGLPQNIDGRNYNGVNSFMLFLLTEKEQYGMPVYMTFMQAKEKGLNVLKGEHSFPVVYWNFSIKDKNGKKIFDGDVVRRETDYYGKHKVYDEPVVWEDDIEKGFLGEPYTSGYCIHGGNWEVIGSIHDGEGGNHA